MRGTVTKKRNRWYICYYVGKDNGGKWIQKWEGSWETKREAERVLRSRIDDLENTFERKADQSTTSVFLQYWLRVYCEARLAPNTIRGYRVNLEKHVFPYIGSIPINRLKPNDIQKLYEDLLASGLSGTSVRYVHNNLHRAFGFAVKQELIPRNPADMVEPPKVDRPEIVPLTLEQVKKLLHVCVDQEIYIPVMLAVTLGLRRGEALGLQWSDVNFNEKTLTVRHSAICDKDGFRLSTPKTKNSRRTLLLPDMVCDALEHTLLTQQAMRREAGSDYNALNLVCCRLDGTPYSTNALQHHFRDILDKHDLPPIRFHDLRHTHATLMLQSHVPAKIVSSMLGHSSIGITMDTYSHVLTEMQEPATGAWNRILQDVSNLC